MQDNKLFTCARSVDGKGFILTEDIYKSRESNSGVTVVLMNIYRPCSNKEKVIRWREIEVKLVNANGLIRCMIGVFNSIRFASKRKWINNGTTNKCKMSRFNEFIERCALRDIPVVGRKFTWYRPNWTTSSRLNRVLVSDNWLMKWPGSKQYVLCKQVFDHCVLVVKNSIIDWVRNPFARNNQKDSKRQS